MRVRYTLCDRCGRKEKNPFEFNSSSKNYDLCATCTQLIEEWINSDKLVIRYRL